MADSVKFSKERQKKKKINSNFIQYTSEHWSKPDKQGELKKQGHVVKNWKVRWFIIQNDTAFYFKQRGVKETEKEKEINIFFKKNQDPKPAGVIPLRGCTTKETNKLNKPFCFEVNASSINKVFYIQCSSQNEVKEWRTAFETGSEYSSVSAPYNVQHEIHVDFDSATGFSVN